MPTQDYNQPMTLELFILQTMVVIGSWFFVGIDHLTEILKLLGSLTPFITLYFSQKRKIDFYLTKWFKKK